MSGQDWETLLVCLLLIVVLGMVSQLERGVTLRYMGAFTVGYVGTGLVRQYLDKHSGPK